MLVASESMLYTFKKKKKSSVTYAYTWLIYERTQIHSIKSNDSMSCTLF